MQNYLKNEKGQGFPVIQWLRLPSSVGSSDSVLVRELGQAAQCGQRKSMGQEVKQIHK